MEYSPKILDIGSGRNKLPGSIGIDFSAFSDADFALNLNSDPLPFEDSSIDFIYSSHCLEHLTLSGFLHIMSEIYRVSKESAQIFIKVPYFNGPINWANPFHNNKICFNEHTFRFFSSQPLCKCLQPEDYITPTCQTWGLRYSANDEINIELETTKIELIYFPEYQSKSDQERTHDRFHLNNVVEAIHYHLRPIKPCPQILAESPVPQQPRYLELLMDLDKKYEKQITYLKSVDQHIDAIRKNEISELKQYQSTIHLGLSALKFMESFDISQYGPLMLEKKSTLLYPPEEIYRIKYEKVTQVQNLIDILPSIDAALVEASSNKNKVLPTDLPPQKKWSRKLFL